MPEPESESIPKTRKVFPNALLISFVFTLISGVYTAPHYGPFINTVIYSGFPFHWLYVIIAFTGRISTSTFLWAGFAVDFLIYAVVAASAIYIYEKKLKQVYKPVWLSAILLVVSCWLFLLHRTYADLTFGRGDFFVFEVGTYDFLLIILRVESFLRFLIGVTLSTFTWVLIKYRKQFSHWLTSKPERNN